MTKVIASYTLLLETSEGPQTVLVSKKAMKRIIFRYDHRAEVFKVSAPLHSSKQEIKMVFYEKESLILKLKKQKKVVQNNQYYYFGEAFPSYQAILASPNPISQVEFYQQTKRGFKNYLAKRTAYYEALMGIDVAHQVGVRDMKTRWGTNAIKRRKITYNLQLIHYHPDIIDAIIVHELAHYFIGGHQADFYALVYRYCPNYKQLAKNLKRGHYDNLSHH